MMRKKTQDNVENDFYNFTHNQSVILLVSQTARRLVIHPTVISDKLARDKVKLRYLGEQLTYIR